MPKIHVHPLFIVSLYSLGYILFVDIHFDINFIGHIFDVSVYFLFYPLLDPSASEKGKLKTSATIVDLFFPVVLAAVA